MGLFGLSNSLGRSGSGAGSSVSPELIAYFVASPSDRKIMKVLANGTVSTFHTFAAGLTPRGVIVDSATATLYVPVGIGGTKQIDIFTDLGEATSAGPNSTVAMTFHGGGGSFIHSAPNVVWGEGSGSLSQLINSNPDASTISDVFSTQFLLAPTYHPGDGKMYAGNLSPASIWSGNPDGTGWAQIIAVAQASIVAPMSHLMGANDYILTGNYTGSRNLGRRDRSDGSGSITWLNLSSPTSSRLRIEALRIDPIGENLVILGRSDGGSFSTGVFTIPLQEGAQAFSELVQVADLSSDITLSALNGEMDILYNQDPESLMSDTV